MSDLICPNCGHRNEDKENNCSICEALLDRTITNRHQFSTHISNFEETTVIPRDIINNMIKSAADNTDPVNNDQETISSNDDNVLETPVETRSVSVENEEIIEAQFGKVSIVGDLVLIHEVSNTEFRISQDQLDEVVIGRQYRQTEYKPTVDLTLLEGHKYGVSRRHATLIHKNGLLMIVDHQSKNGTYLNGLRITAEQPRIIRDSDIIRIGLISLRVHYQTK